MGILQIDHQLAAGNYYETTVSRPRFLALENAISVDVLVIGGGFAGLNAAIELAKRGYQVALLEAGQVCSGASGRNGGQVIAGFACGQAELRKQIGAADAKRAWQMSLEAIALVDARIAEFQIDCERVHGYLTVADSARKARALQAEVLELQNLYGFASEWKTGAAVAEHIASPRYVASAYDTVSGHLNPLQYGLGLARAAESLGVQIFEHSAVTKLERSPRLCAHTQKGRVSADFAVLAGNYRLPELSKLAPELAARIMPVGTYMLASEPLDAAVCEGLIARNAAVCDNNFVLDYFRLSGGKAASERRFLFGGGVSYTGRTPAHLQQSMQARMAAIFPSLHAVKAEHIWGGFVDISMLRAPDFGRLDPRIYYLQGFSGYGVAATGLGGLLVAEAIAGQAERFDLFARIKQYRFMGGKSLRAPLLALGMLYYRLKDRL